MENRIISLVVVLVFIGLGGGWYYYYSHYYDQPQEAPAAQVAPPPETTPPPAPESPVRYPLATPPADDAKSLPSLEDSDGPMQKALAELMDKAALKRFLNLDSIVRRVVVTVDNLPRRKLPQQYDLAKPVVGKFLVTGKDENVSLNAENYRRYVPYVLLAEAIDLKKLVAAYRHFYPLFQEEYKNLGSAPKQYFNDRVVEVIDDLLAAPELPGSIKLVQPKVFYQFADPTTEALSAGQKIMMRMGGDNAARVKVKLKELRRELTAAAK